MNVAVLGASNKPERYSYKAVMMLREQGHAPYPVHPLLKAIEGLPVYASLRNIHDPIDVITVYLSAKHQQTIAGDILNSGARSVIFNPGAENPELAAQLNQKGIKTQEACTLVLLKTGQF